MNRIKRFLVRLFGLEPITIFSHQPIGIDTDIDYRRTGKTTMRLRAAYNHLERNAAHEVVYVTSTRHRSLQIRRLVKSEYPQYVKRFTFITPQTRLVGRTFTKIIYDLHVI